MSELRDRVVKAYEDHFGKTPEVLARAPGRVNLIGEHTDYNDGFVLPCAIDFETVVAAGPRNDGVFRVIALDVGGDIDEFRADEIAFDQDRDWTNYVRGMMALLAPRAHPLPGADLVLSGNVPQGAGLSSSASLEMGLGVAMRALFDLSLDDADLARLGQRAENEFVGCSCGIMDQMASIGGRADHAMLLDCRSLNTRSVAMPEGVAVVIIDSNKARGLVDSAYNERRAQCEAAARFFGVAALRDVDETRLSERAGLDDVSARRARHVVSENARTLAAADALAAGDLRAMGRLMANSHESMRDDFEITVPEIDALVEIAQAAIGPEGGARMTGGGFGGCVVALLDEARVGTLVDAVRAQYEARTGLKERIFVCTAQPGAGVLPL